MGGVYFIFELCNTTAKLSLLYPYKYWTYLLFITIVVRDQTAIDRGGNNYLSRPSSYHDYPTLEPLPYQYKKYDQNFLWLISDAR